MEGILHILLIVLACIVVLVVVAIAAGTAYLMIRTNRQAKIIDKALKAGDEETAFEYAKIHAAENQDGIQEQLSTDAGLRRRTMAATCPVLTAPCAD